MLFGVCYYVLGSPEMYLEFIEDESLECVIHRVKTNDFTGVRFARTGLDEVPYINICSIDRMIQIVRMEKETLAKLWNEKMEA